MVSKGLDHCIRAIRGIVVAVAVVVATVTTVAIVAIVAVVAVVAIVGSLLTIMAQQSLSDTVSDIYVAITFRWSMVGCVLSLV